MATASAIRWLRSIASCFFFTLAVLIAALWVRSYFCVDLILTEDLSGDVRDVSSTFQSNKARIFYQQRSVENGKLDHLVRLAPQLVPHAEYKYRKWLATSGPNRVSMPIPPNFRSFLDIGWRSSVARDGDRHFSLLLHLWLPTLTTALLAIAIRPAPRFKFGLRDLLTLTTVAALTVGPLTFWLRSLG